MLSLSRPLKLLFHLYVGYSSVNSSYQRSGMFRGLKQSALISAGVIYNLTFQPKDGEGEYIVCSVHVVAKLKNCRWE